MIYLPIDIKEKWLKIDIGISELKKTRDDISLQIRIV